MPAKTIEIQQYKKKMRELSRERTFRARFREVTRQPPEQTERQLSELGLNTNGSHRAKAERLFRCMLRVIGVADVSWYPDRDEAGGMTVPEEEEWLMEQSDVESEVDREQRSNRRPPVWPSNKDFPPISEKTTTVTRNQPVQQLVNNSASASNTTNIQHEEPRPTDNTNIMPRITVNADR